MAKVRVYELARELNMDSKALVEKLKTGGMSIIKNYMSTLDEEAVTRAKEIISGSVSEVIEEKRIKPTVIRRRRKKVKIEPEKPQKEIEETKEAAKDEVRLEEEPEEKLKPTPRKTKVEAEAAKKKKPKKTKKKKSDRPAKIIKKPDEGPLKAVLSKKKLKEVIVERTVKIKSPERDFKDVTVEDKKEGPARKKKDKKKVVKLETPARGSVRHRKLEVFERADLYEGRKVRRKKKEAGAKEARKKLKQTEITVPKAIKRKIKIQETVTVSDLAKAMGIKAVQFLKKLMSLGVKANINQSIDFETASLLADEFGYELELDKLEVKDIVSEKEDKQEDLKLRPPVVTIMGHVDHGKTSLLDYIRKSNIIAGESGGITQHIGAYYVQKKGGDIVFIDTPGHEAFTAMRARGAKVTDIIVLVVAADDGVMPQTREAVNHGRAANIPIIVAVNKIDKPEADVDKVLRELAELELVPEDWGGDTIFGNISAKTGEGVDEFLELILLQAEILELKANPNKPARGTIVEARLDKSRGSIATVLIKSGTLKPGDYFICGEHYGRVRAMLNHQGQKMISTGPSMPAEIYGISGVPMAGDEFIVVQDDKSAKQVIDHRQSQMRSKEISGRGVVSLDDFFDKIKEGEIKELNIVIKADVQGSLEALSEALIKLGTEEVKPRIIHSSTGAITESDVMLASASGAIIIGFNVRANLRVTDIAEKEKVNIRYYDVIYKTIQDIRKAMAGLLDPIYKENVIGRVDIKEVFHVPKTGTIAGCYVTDGYVERNSNVRLLRDEVVIYNGKLASLRRFKDDAKEVQSGYECGIGLENFQDIKPGDVFEIYQIEELAAEL